MRRRTRFAPWGVLAALALIALPGLALASSHSEAPGTAKDRLADDTDLYAYVSPDAPNAVTLVGLWVPLIEPNSGPNFASFDDEAHYYFNIDNVGDAQDHIRYEFTFHTSRLHDNTFLYNTGVVTSLADPDLNVRQTWSLTRIDGGVETPLISDAPTAPQYVGPVSMPDYASLAQSAITTLPGGTKVFVGPRDDPFFVDLGAIFDLLTIRKVPGNKGKGVDGVGGFNVMAIVMQIPMNLLTRDQAAPNATNSVIGIYESTERLQNRTINGDGTVSVSGPEMQVSRLGHPLVNEVVIGLGDKDRFNATKPPQDFTFLHWVTEPGLPGLLNALYGISVPSTPRTDLVTVFLTGVPGLNQPANPKQVPCDMLRLNLAIPPSSAPSRLGVLAGDIAGFPNGRRLADDVVDIEERVAAGVLVPGFNIAPNNQLGDGIDANDVPFLPYFPYVAPPHSPFLHEHHPEQHGNAIESIRANFRPNGSGAAAELKLSGANPARTSALQYSLPTPARVSLRIYDAQGRLVRTLVEQDAAAGSFRALWDGRSDEGAQSGRGVYFARFVSNGTTVDTKKLVIE